MKPATSLNNVVICRRCDAALSKPNIQPGHKAICPGCGALLFELKKNPMERTMAVSLAGLLLFFPAILLPMIGVSAAGAHNEASLIDCIVILLNSGYHIVALIVFLFTIAIPIVHLLAAFYIAVAVHFNKISQSLLVFFRSYHVLDSWTMLHVFFLGVIVSIYKIVDLAELTVGGGLISFVLLLICSTLVSVTLDHYYVWEKMEQALED
ncbi:paraquat-inducible protein A [Thalassotalea euphylliae]|uniref:Paraquat-inducible protein A n=1 Tax=Thalassotalea euphylliae TaxID=1655234 RepID=A0A3E0TXD1_9GAMM|nr:paraquat-inducible protein A [Thalassotalea euphylliae]REL28625.1 paraquat-inducible protein A [Thalassotalea euphylliae]